MIFWFCFFCSLTYPLRAERIFQRLEHVYLDLRSYGKLPMDFIYNARLCRLCLFLSFSWLLLLFLVIQRNNEGLFAVAVRGLQCLILENLAILHLQLQPPVLEYGYE